MLVVVVRGVKTLVEDGWLFDCLESVADCTTVGWAQDVEISKWLLTSWIFVWWCKAGGGGGWWLIRLVLWFGDVGNVFSGG